MKLFRFGPAGSEKCGVILADGSRLDVSAQFPHYDENFFQNDGLLKLAGAVDLDRGAFPIVPEEVRYGVPIARPSKIVCIGLNYVDHAHETNAKIPKEPILFFKSTTALTGPNDGLLIPHDSVKTDWEVELALVIGRVARRVSEADALAYVAGYALHNDYSERTWQIERGGQWVKGKSADTFAPLGPWLVTCDEVPEPQKLALWLTVNGQKMQNGNTANMIFGCAHLVHYVSQFMTLLPGDVISTGTPAGVGLGMKPPLYLKPGDVIELGIDGLGTQKQLAIADSDHS